MRVDAHQHFWRLSRGDYRWLRGDDAALAPLRRDFMPADLQPALAAAGIERTVLVQAADATAETEFMLELSAAHPFIAGVVGWVDLSCADAVATLEQWASHAAFKGVRPMLQDLPQPDWIERAPHPAVLLALLRLGLRFDALVLPQQLEPLLRFVRAWPELPVVIDHAAKPPLAEGWKSPAYSDWRRRIAALAALPGVHCKLSGLLTLLPQRGLSSAEAVVQLRPLWNDLLDLFGPARLMWGSDWPVLTLAAGHADWVAVSEGLFDTLSPVERARLWGGTAARFYGIR
jgi:L-fuconolactonase